MPQIEQTFIMAKPDGVQRGLVGEIIKRFEQKGYYLRALKLMNVEEKFAQEHYKDLADKPFFPGLVQYIASSPVVAMVWEGLDVVIQGRKLVGATNPLAAEPGSIRADFCLAVGRNIIHGSDSVESAKREIELWFPEGLCEYTPTMRPWIYED
eukprot:TRINITY_DN2555_c0_g1_i1.p2 TRINITY_DN2555_c0_g1~~TRINITY_DN2555_c0_g1_i1.p2  ORF type:complete len:153 (-),score=21.33 TRINITY_DN2555_c0_g1_i1:157-615(-)